MTCKDKSFSITVIDKDETKIILLQSEENAASGQTAHQHKMVVRMIHLHIVQMSFRCVFGLRLLLDRFEQEIFANIKNTSLCNQGNSDVE